MRRTALHRLGLAVAAAAALAGCGSSATTSTGGAGAPSTSSTSSTTTATTSATPAPTGHRLSVQPAAVGATSTVTFGFSAPASSGRQGSIIISYALGIAGPHRTGCVGLHQTDAPGVRGRVADVIVGPAQLHGSWCDGPYVASVREIAQPYCRPSQACPQWVRIVGIVATGRFTVA